MGSRTEDRKKNRVRQAEGIAVAKKEGGEFGTAQETDGFDIYSGVRKMESQ
ncbi:MULTISPECIES: hypothetical protein [Paenibacillus]|jgi:hypothetical protein|uniref:hypothetical protein n=1 Tax=Paenibacillus TaxID=44249 RepID=UPI000ADF72C0|nr:hypothetical protein [Paenibacillus peoriae]